MFNGKLGALLLFDEAALPLVRAWINDEEVRQGTGTEGPVSDREHRRWYESVMDDPSQRIFLIAEGKGSEPHRSERSDFAASTGGRVMRSIGSPGRSCGARQRSRRRGFQVIAPVCL